MLILTERKSLKKIKLFSCNGCYEKFSNNLKNNRKIPDEDLVVYKVIDQLDYIPEDRNYSIVGDELTLYKEVEVNKKAQAYTHWFNIPASKYREYYSNEVAEKLDIILRKYTIDQIQSFYSGNEPFPVNFCVFNGEFLKINPVLIEYDIPDYINEPFLKVKLEKLL